MDHTLVGIVRQRRMVMELCVRPQDMVCDKEVGVAHRFYSLNKLAYGSRISTEFCLGKNRSDVHGVPPLTGPGIVLLGPGIVACLNRVHYHISQRYHCQPPPSER